MNKLSFNVLMADDDAEDCMIVKDAFDEVIDSIRFLCVEDGKALTDYLRRTGKYADEAAYPSPDLILLDLNMPLKNGSEALKEIREDLACKAIPIVVLTTSSSPKDVSLCYELGANTFITKPMGFPEMVHVIDSISKYWFEVAKLPSSGTC